MAMDFTDWLQRHQIPLEEISVEIVEQFFRQSTPHIPVGGVPVTLRNRSFDPRQWNPRYPYLWRGVTPEVGLPKAGAFGHSFFVELFCLYPGLREDVICFQYAFQMEDTWALFDRQEVPFSVQVDLALRYIIILDSLGYRNEVGRFCDDPERAALEVIGQRFMGSEIAR
jgi:hypothetical protein